MPSPVDSSSSRMCRASRDRSSSASPAVVDVRAGADPPDDAARPGRGRGRPGRGASGTPRRPAAAGTPGRTAPRPAPPGPTPDDLGPVVGVDGLGPARRPGSLRGQPGVLRPPAVEVLGGAVGPGHPDQLGDALGQGPVLLLALPEGLGRRLGVCHVAGVEDDGPDVRVGQQVRRGRLHPAARTRSGAGSGTRGSACRRGWPRGRPSRRRPRAGRPGGRTPPRGRPTYSSGGYPRTRVVAGLAYRMTPSASSRVTPSQLFSTRARNRASLARTAASARFRLGDVPRDLGRADQAPGLVPDSGRLLDARWCGGGSRR